MLKGWDFFSATKNYIRYRTLFRIIYLYQLLSLIVTTRVCICSSFFLCFNSKRDMFSYNLSPLYTFTFNKFHQFFAAHKAFFFFIHARNSFCIISLRIICFSFISLHLLHSSIYFVSLSPNLL